MKSMWIIEIIISLWLLLVISSYPAYGAPRHAQLTITPSDQHVKRLHSNLILTCTVEHQGAHKVQPHLYWFDAHGERIESASGRIRVESPSTNIIKLYISDLHITDSGTYKCTFSGRDSKLEKTVEVRVLDDVIFDENVDSIFDFGVGDDALLLCGALPALRPSISWRTNSTPIVSSRSKSGKYFVNKDGNLLVKKLTNKDGGMYECRAVIDALGLFKSRHVELRVLYPPQNLEISVVGRVVEGQPLHVTCHADGSPPLKYEWLKEQILSEKVRAKIPVVRRNSSLWLEKMESKHETKYFCRVSNGRGTAEAYIDVKMLTAPSIKAFIQKRTIIRGAPLVVNCEASGMPTPMVTWFKYSSSTFLDANDTVAVSTPKYGSSKLIFSEIDGNDEGVFFCFASNEISDTSQELQINVEYAPSIQCEPPVQHGWIGQIRTFNCTASGKPLPSLQWTRAGQNIEDIFDVYRVETSPYQTENVTSTLRIYVHPNNEAWIYGGYSCLSKNIHGTQSYEVKLHRAVVPVAPQSVIVDNTTSTSATLQVKVESSIPEVSSWRIKYDQFDSNQSKFEYISLNSDERKVTVTNLKPGTKYVMFISAGNEAGYGEAVEIHLETKSAEQHGLPSSSEELKGEESSSSINVEVLTACTSAVFIISTIAVGVVYIKKKRMCLRHGQSLNGGIRCYSWYDATTDNRKASPQFQGTWKKASITDEHSEIPVDLGQDKLEDQKTLFSLTRTYSRRKNSGKYLPTEVALSPEHASMKTGTSSLDFTLTDIADTSSGVYEEIPKSDSTAVSEILDEYHLEGHADDNETTTAAQNV